MQFDLLLNLAIAVFVHEDAAVLLAVHYIAKDDLPFVSAFVVLYVGMLAGDLLIFGLGRLARRDGRIAKRFIGARIRRLGDWVGQHLYLAAMLCRVLPGTLFPLFVACGWFGIPLQRFAAATATSGYVYLSVAMAAGLVFDNLVLSTLHLDDLTVYACIIALVLVVSYRRALWGFLFRLTEGFNVPAAAGPDDTQAPIYRGMPAPKRSPTGASRCERIPAPIFYIPIILHWIWLSIRYRSVTLPTLANPLIETGGFMGESKSKCMDMVGEAGRPYLARFVAIDKPDTCEDGAMLRDTALAVAQAAGIACPFVVKPDIGWRGFGVRLIRDVGSFDEYLAAFPTGARLIVQEYVGSDGEIAILHAREPDAATGTVLSMTLRYFPQVVGDGHRTVRELILANARAKWKADYFNGASPDHCGLGREILASIPARGTAVRLALVGSNRVGGLYVDAIGLLTPELKATVDRIAGALPEFHFGRFDIKFECVDSLQRGEGLKIVEVNGAGAEAIHIWDPDKTLLDAYLTLFRQNECLFRIGSLNRARGFRPTGPFEFLRYIRRQNWLTKRYPPSN